MSMLSKNTTIGNKKPLLAEDYLGNGPTDYPLAVEYKNLTGDIDLNDIIIEGNYTLYNLTTATHFPTSITYTGVSNSSHLQVFRFNDENVMQLITKRNSTTMYFRCRYNISNGYAWSNWYKSWNEENDGSSSGLDADKLDSYHSSKFAQLYNKTVNNFNSATSVGFYCISGNTNAPTNYNLWGCIVFSTNISGSTTSTSNYLVQIAVQDGVDKINTLYIRKKHGGMWTSWGILDGDMKMSVYDRDADGVIDDVALMEYYGTSNISMSPANCFTVSDSSDNIITGLTEIGKMQTQLVIPYKINNNSIQEVRNITSTNLYSCKIPSSVEVLNTTFVGCYNLTDLSLPHDLYLLTGNVFSGCSSLTSITIPEHVSVIEDYCFNDCSSLKSITFLNNNISISEHAVHSFMAGVGVPLEGLTFYCEQGSTAEKYAKTNGYNIIYTNVSDIATETELERIKYYGDKDIVPSDESYFNVNTTGDTITSLTTTGQQQTELVIPYKINGKLITKLDRNSPGSSILEGAQNTIQKIIIPNTITTIGVTAFYNCIALTSINLPDSITNIKEESCFDGCTSLTHITLPKNITSIPHTCFSSCAQLKTINVPKTVTSIGDDAFNNCHNLTIYCEQGSYADIYAQQNNIPVLYTDIDANKFAQSEKIMLNNFSDVPLKVGAYSVSSTATDTPIITALQAWQVLVFRAGMSGSPIVKMFAYSEEKNILYSKTSNSTGTAWDSNWTKLTGSGSLLDADKLDGKQAVEFIYTGNYTSITELPSHTGIYHVNTSQITGTQEIFAVTKYYYNSSNYTLTAINCATGDTYMSSRSGTTFTWKKTGTNVPVVTSDPTNAVTGDMWIRSDLS